MRRETLSEGFGKRGEAVFGLVATVMRFTPEAEVQIRALCTSGAARADILAVMRAPGNVVGFQKLNVLLGSANNHTQDAYAALAMVELSLANVKEAFPWVHGLIGQSDNAGNFHCNLFAVGVWHVARHQGMLLLRLCHNTPGHGKNVVDHLFGSVKGSVMSKVNAGVDVESALHFVCTGAHGAHSNQ